MNKCMKVVHWSDVINKNTIKYTFNRKQTYRFILKKCKRNSTYLS